MADRQPFPTPIGDVTGLVPERDVFFNRRLDIQPPPPKKHPRNQVIDKAVEDALAGTEGGDRRPPLSLEKIMQLLFGGP
jgi:hypothetical protein